MYARLVCFRRVSFQPVELAKMALILILAYSISNFGRRFERSLYFWHSDHRSVCHGFDHASTGLGSAVLLGTIWFALMR